jgi:hypothetical protein
MKDKFPIYLVGTILFGVIVINLLNKKTTNKVNASGKPKPKPRNSGGGFSAADFNQKKLNNLYVLQRK